MTESLRPGATLKTGEVCTQSGFWQVSGRPRFRMRIAKDHVMPPCEGKTAIWRYLGPLAHE